MGPTRVTAAVPTPSHPLHRCVGDTAGKYQRLHQAKKSAHHAKRLLRTASLFLLRLFLGLHRFGESGSEKHGSETGYPCPEKIDRGGTTLRNLLAVSRPSFATTPSPPTSKRRRRQTTHEESDQPPFSFVTAHNTPLKNTDLANYLGTGVSGEDSRATY